MLRQENCSTFSILERLNLKNLKTYSIYACAMKCRGLIVLFSAMLLFMAQSCSNKGLDTEVMPRKYVGRTDSPKNRKVLLLYSAGFNDLSTSLEDDVNDLQSGYVPRKMESADVILVFSRRPSDYSYRKKSPSYLYRISLDVDDNVVRDTLRTWDAEMPAASAETLNSVLSYVNGTFPSCSYGMVFSSHATGWLPADPAPATSSVNASPSSVGVDMTDSSSASYQIDIEDFASAIPMKLDYLIFDACLMGGVEVAYALKDKCDKVIFSQTETMADGLCDYRTLTQRLLKPDEPDLTAMCEDAYSQYMALTGLNRSFTVSMVDCAGMEPLAEICRTLFSKYRTAIASVDPSVVQEYFHTYFASSARRHYFYDLDDILEQSGVSAAEMAQFREILGECVLYKAATPRFLNLTIDKHCGLSMYLPANGTADLDAYYMTLSWNRATGLVR